MNSDPSQVPSATGASRLSRVLVVDDDSSVRLVTSGALRRFGHEVHQASSGDEALAQVAKRPQDFEVMILDLTMPGLSGRELLAVMKRDFPHVAVIISSGHHLETSSFKPEPDGVLRKPFRVSALLELVDLVLSRIAKGQG